MLPTIEKFCDFLQARLSLPPQEQEAEVPTLWRCPPSQSRGTSIKRLVLALDFCVLDVHTINSHHSGEADALFLHRPFDLPTDFLPDTPVIASHRGFDAHLSVGWNPSLAQTLCLQNVAPLYRNSSEDGAHPIGMVGDLTEPIAFSDLLHSLSTEFGGMEAALINGRETVGRLAIMGAMTPGLIRQASEAGAQGYLTGQVREVARAEATRCGIAVYATGHKRAEWWGLQKLAHELEEAFPGLQTVVAQ